MTHHIKGQGRHQVTLLPEVLDDFVTKDNPVRVIDVFVDELQLDTLGFERVNAKQTGRPGYHPATMLKLYIYGYLNRIQSSRRLEKEAHRNVELMWLLERLTPDFKTIADFRKNNGKGIKNACRAFIDLCRQMQMFTDVVVAIDGSKFKAVNSKSNNFTPQKTKGHIERVERSIVLYLNKLDEADKAAEPEKNAGLTAAKLAWLQKRLEELKQIQQAVEQHPDKQLSLTDPDSRLMKINNVNRQVSYNVQTAVDAKYHLIVTHEVTNTPDRGQLTAVTKLAQDAVGKADITVLADKGYYSRGDIKATQDLGAVALVPKGDTSGADRKGLFNRSLFKYDQEKDIYICPMGSELQNRFKVVEDGLEQQMYFNNIACRDCSQRSRCTTSKRDPRRIRRWVHEAEMEDMQTRLNASPQTAVVRKQTVEHPFGTIKMWMGATHFLMQRFKNVSTEISLHVLAYNLKRMMSIWGTEGLAIKLREQCN
ncbi:IS1182 family transposase [Citrobacter sp. Cpo102]|uniref:IS1182 family transposase n=1 Tax=Citrobacter sp. Cpo102 TaxID=2985142 RepID=UPI00257725AF|nr:IS1182 family transposase [Citrobacter sp. Cpo102]MDM2816062.1 IS1182 family transposase [Citrobacter sp. Cpo102]MDM2816645.1 IS1182 family transposase [Citrobacter sp. Cpo102]MDM2817567.1 IS1182 family transposase [Citrobacter sp. Cpo102]MDM2817761.1 IS1182 family transposase [Citrobacter sp. Cpo102]MDM2817869.1 IS1182 family transposase [Citrobacter sp. Cpo102]